MVLQAETPHALKRAHDERDGCLLSFGVSEVLLVEGEGLCVCVCERERERERRNTISESILFTNEL